MIDRDGYLQVLEQESTALLAAARAADPAAAVPGCPAWTVADLLWHIGEVHDFWGFVVRERALAPHDYVDPVRPGGGAAGFDALHTFAGERAAELHRVLTEADPATPVWSWTPQHDVAFVVRRMAHETAVHRADAERALGREHRLDPVLAADGIDEFLAFFLSRRSSAAAPLDGSVHLHCSDPEVPDGEGEWTVRTADDGRYVVTRDHTKADVALRGDAHDLLMTLWRRQPIDRVTVFGDAGLAADLIARPDLE